MSNHKEHKHASVLRAIADGVPLSEFETSKNQVFWRPLGEYQISHLDVHDVYIRRKPQYIVVNGFKVPKPLESLLYAQDYYAVSIRGCIPTAEEFSNSNKSLGIIHCSSGLVHQTSEAAIAHAKAMLGIDPEYFED